MLRQAPIITLTQKEAKELGITIPTVGKWRKRFAEQRLPGLRDSERTGKPPTYEPDFRDRLFDLMEKAPPEGMARWDCPTLACWATWRKSHMVWRLLRKKGIYLHRARS